MKLHVNDSIFDYRTLRLTMGFIALALPWVVCFFSAEKLVSISHSYYSNSRDIFVGMMAIVAAFLFAYNGHTLKQACFSKVAGVSAMLLGLFPTTCVTCDASFSGYIHNIAAISLFSILAYFCIGPFREGLKGAIGKRALRSNIYLICGWIMIISIASIVVFPETIRSQYEIIFWAEAAALTAFGIAWVVAGKYFSIFVNAEEKLNIFDN